LHEESYLVWVVNQLDVANNRINRVGFHAAVR
jgi:hypothetical protein